MRKRYKLALSLGGGGARGFVHIGVLKFFEEKGFLPDLIVGTSMGAVVGGLFAYKKSCEYVYKAIKDFLESEYNPETFETIRRADYKESKSEEGFFYSLKKLFARGIIYSKTFTNISLISEDSYFKDLQIIMPDIEFKDLKVDFLSIALDLHSGREIVIKGGNLRRAIAASCAIPGVFPPIKWKKYLLVDGGWVDKNPVIPAILFGAKNVICSNCTSFLEEEEKYENALSIILRSDNIATHRLGKIQTADANFIIEPDLRDIHWVDFDSIDKIVEIGYEYTKKKFPEIVKSVKGKWFDFLMPSKRVLKTEMEFIDI